VNFERSAAFVFVDFVTYLWAMIQQIAVVLIFAGAVGYVGRLVYKSFQAKSSCATGCGKCAVVDFEKIEKQIQHKGGI